MLIGIVGANGFIGRHLCRAVPEAIPITRSNLSDIKKCGIIFNVAAKLNGNLDEMMDSNFYLPKYILENTYATYIHAGSSVEYGNNIEAPSEDTPLSPVTPYALTKSLASSLVQYYGNNGRKCCNLRLYCVYGDGDRSETLISTIIRNAKNGRFPIFDNPLLARDFINVKDVCKAFILANKNLKKENYGQAFNIGSGTPTNLSKIAEITQKAFNIQEKPTFKNLPYQVWYSNPSKARDLLGFTPKMDIEVWIHKKANRGR